VKQAVRTPIRPGVLPFAPGELERVLLPLAEARQLPARAYDDPAVLELERAAIFGRWWVAGGREHDLGLPGAYAVVPVSPAGSILVRGPDLTLRALENLCRHRGATLVEGSCGRADALVCPYHRWSYDLRGRLVEAPHTGSLKAFERSAYGLLERPVACAHGFAFLGPVGSGAGAKGVAEQGAAAALAEQLDGLDEQLEGPSPLGARLALHLGRSVAHDVGANWKLLIENFLESHHFPTIHPELERLTPSGQAQTLASRGRWLGGTMLLATGAETVSSDGLLHGRPLLRRDAADRRVYDYLIWPNLLLSFQPDYMLTYRIYPLSPCLTRVVAETYFHAETGTGAFDLSGVLGLWDRINRQDHRVCERQQVGLGSRPAEPGVYAEVEESTHAFDRWIAEAYLTACR
jgi:glycine betaine catabolism A